MVTWGGILFDVVSVGGDQP